MYETHAPWPGNNYGRSRQSSSIGLEPQPSPSGTNSLITGYIASQGTRPNQPWRQLLGSKQRTAQRYSVCSYFIQDNMEYFTHRHETKRNERWEAGLCHTPHIPSSGVYRGEKAGRGVCLPRAMWWCGCNWVGMARGWTCAHSTSREGASEAAAIDADEADFFFRDGRRGRDDLESSSSFGHSEAELTDAGDRKHRPLE